MPSTCHELNNRVPAQIDLNHPDKLGNTSLHQAALFDQSVMIHMFLEKGASTTATNNIGRHARGKLLITIRLIRIMMTSV